MYVIYIGHYGVGGEYWGELSTAYTSTRLLLTKAEIENQLIHLKNTLLAWIPQEDQPAPSLQHIVGKTTINYWILFTAFQALVGAWYTP